MNLLSSAVEAFYWYDGNGTMVKSEINGIVTYYAGRHYHKVVNGESETIRKFYTAGSANVAMRANGVLTWVLSDHLGSASVTANEDGSFLNETRYREASCKDTAFGEVRTGFSSLDTSYESVGSPEPTLQKHRHHAYSPVAKTVVPTASPPLARKRQRHHHPAVFLICRQCSNCAS